MLVLASMVEEGSNPYSRAEGFGDIGLEVRCKRGLGWGYRAEFGV